MLGLTAALASAAHAGELPSPEEAVARVEALHATLLAVAGGGLDYEARHAALDPAVAEAYDLGFMAAKVLGSHRRKLTTEERTAWKRMFRDLTVATYASRFADADIARFETLDTEPSAQDTLLVRTRIHPREDPPVELDYRLRVTPEGVRIIDVFLNGTVSELALRRADYGSLVRREGFAALLSAVEARIADARAGVAIDPAR